MRILKANLQQYIADRNSVQCDSGSVYFFKYGHHTGWHRVELYMVEASGNLSCVRSLAAGTPKECIEQLRGENYYGYNNRCEKPNRVQAFIMLQMTGIDFTDSYYRTNSSQKLALKVWAKLTGYRYSDKTGRGVTKNQMFFENLAKN